MYRALSVTLSFLFLACGGEEQLTPMVSPFHGAWQYLSGEYHMRCPNEKPLDIDLTRKFVGLTQIAPGRIQSFRLTPCDLQKGEGLIWTIAGAAATIHASCETFTYEGTLSLSGQTITVNLTENEDDTSVRACKATRQGTLTKLSNDPVEAERTL